ncbi:MAG: hypothetical protein NC301_01860 [Bacteroides sp.]|nr:hypothetical protein [Bacteroides sp.]MCM1378628.1 hypothetical protein [Bacteroides sp.]MCM1446398.1 hypothetical protein [Prevotella sp.]
MKIFTKALALAAILSAGAAHATPVVFEVNCTTGTFTETNGNGNYARTWVSTATNPSLTASTGGANNVDVRSTGALEVHSGNPGPCTLTFTTDEGWMIIGYSFTATTTTSTSTLNYNGTTAQVTPTTPITVNVTLAAGEAPSIGLTGDNKGVLYEDLRVTVEEVGNIDLNAPALEVDPQPAADKIGDLMQTDIVGNHFNQFTAWYHLTDGDYFLSGANATANTSKAQVLLDNNIAYTDEMLYCVVNGTLYNKAGGVATPVSGAVVNASGVTIGGKPVTANLAQKYCPIKVELGSVTNNNSGQQSTWNSCWTSNYEPVVTFSCAYNNMAINNGEFQIERGQSGGTWSFASQMPLYISDYTFLAKKNGSYTEETKFTPVGGTETALTEYYKRINGSGYNGETTLANFAQAGTNGKGAIVTDIYVTVRRSYARVNEREGYVIYKKEGVERRIPAIARVWKGDHAGRLITIYDYRHNGGDIGGGNISLQISVSDDNGATWSTPDYLKDKDGNYVTTYPEGCRKGETADNWATFQADPNTYWNVAFGDAAIVADRESGKLLMMAVGGPTGFFNGRYDNPNQCVRWTSDDGGDTWTPATRVTYDILDLLNGEPTYGKIDSQFIGSGRIMQSRYVKVGDYYRVYCVIASQNSGGNTRNFMLYSDDFGQHWNVLGGKEQCPTSTGAGDECKAEELPDGSVILAGRNRHGNRNFNIFRYTDVTKAEGKWTGHIVTDMGFGTINACDGEIMVLPAVCNDDNTDCYLVLQSFPYGGARNYVSIAWQGIKQGAVMKDADMFKTWEGRYRIANGSSVYSTMAWQANDKLAFFWEDKNCDGTYLDLSIEEITDGQYSYKPDVENKTAIRLTKELIEERMKEDFSALEGDYVGMMLKGNAAAIDKKAGEYQTTPSYKTYVQLNKLIYGAQKVDVADNGVYRFTSAHDGVYTSFTNPRYLAANGTNLISTETDDNNNLFKVESTADGYYTLYNDANKVYADTLLAGNNQALTVSTGRDNAGAFYFTSDNTGHTAIVNNGAKSGSYPAIHMAGNGNIVIWSTTAGASQWYMELIDEPDGYVAPTFTEPTYDDYEFNYEHNLPQSEVEADAIREVTLPADKELYFDLQGHQITTPRAGQLYITNTGRKVIRR